MPLDPSALDRLAAAIADRYRVDGVLGRGGMATVLGAHDLKHDRPVAIKVLEPELSAAIGGERFLAEIRTTAALQHPHILPLFDSGEAAGLLYYVMPLVEGESLRDRLDREVQLPVEEALRIATAVAGALDYAHRRGVLHRDIKPANILLHDGQPLLADFGIALALDSAGNERLTETGLGLGTPQYMSPEQATADRELTPATDLYALASVTYEMVAGSPPFTAPSQRAVLMKTLTEEAPPVSQLRRSVPPHVVAALGRALEKIPADRFPSARAFGEALTDPARMDSGPVPTGRGGGSPGETTKGRRGRRIVATVAAAAAVAAAVAWVGMKGVGDAGAGAGADPTGALRSVAVLPFENASTDPENEYFADGIAEEVLTLLVEVDGLLVTSRSSSFSFKGTQTGIPEIARQLRVDHVLEGSVRRVGDRVRVSARLVDVDADRNVWSDIYEREISDVFAIQRDIAAQITTALRGVLVGAAASDIPDVDPEAYDLYLQGRYLLHQAGAGLLQAEELFTEVVRLEPDFAAGWASLARTLLVIPEYTEVEAASVAPRAIEAAERALALDPEEVEAALVLAEIQGGRGEQRVSITALETIAGRYPGHALAQALLGSGLLKVGYLDEGRARLERLVDLDPLSHVSMDLVALGRLLTGRFDEVPEPAVQANRLRPSSGGVTLFFLAQETGDYGAFDEAADFGFGWLHSDWMTISGYPRGTVSESAFEDHIDTLQSERRTRIAAWSRFMKAYVDRDPGALWDAADLLGAFDHDFMTYLWSPSAAWVRADPGFAELAEREGWVELWRTRGWPDLCGPSEDGAWECDSAA